jgi:anti-anti-sigma factor
MAHEALLRCSTSVPGPVVEVWRRSTENDEVALVTLDLVGEVCRETVGVIRNAALAAVPDSTHRLVLDLRHVTFLDAGGLSLFVELDQRCQQGHRRLELVRPPCSVARLLEIARLDELIKR